MIRFEGFRKQLLLTVIAAFSALPFDLHAIEYHDSTWMHFRQSRTELDTTYMGNGELLGRLRSRLHRFRRAHGDASLLYVEVVGGASPEGKVSLNEQLSRERGNRIFDYFKNTENLPDSLTKFVFLGRNWAGLLAAVEADKNVPNREETLTLLQEIVDSRKNGVADSEENVQRLRLLAKGKPWNYLYKNHFPTLRLAKLSLVYDLPFRPGNIPDPKLDLAAMPGPVAMKEVDIPQPEIKIRSPFYMDIRTNMLYDAAGVPNIGADFYLGRNFTIGGNWMYAWWRKNSKHRYYRLYGGDINFRYFFGKAAEEKPLTGHHAGIYAQVATYDFEFGGKGYMGGQPGGSIFDRTNYGAGIEYGYSLPVAKRLNIDFTVGVGYFGGKVVTYDPMGDKYVWKSTKQLNWFGPTKAEISLVWLIGYGNVNKK